MKFRARLLFLLASCIVALPLMASAEIPQVISYQGLLTDSTGNPIDGAQLIKFRIYDDSLSGTLLWDSDFQIVGVENGLFNVFLGMPPMPPIPVDLFGLNPDCYLGVTVDIYGELASRTRLVSMPYAFQANEASVSERVRRNRDLYHEIIDINPNSTTTVNFVTFFDSCDITLYLYGSAFQGALLAHTHSGNNAHSHGITGTVGDQSVVHTHSFSGTTADGGVAHSHSGSTSDYNLSHSHPASSSPYNLSHSHSGTTNTDGAHHHDFIFDGTNDGLYLVHQNNVSPNVLTAHGIWDVTASGSVAPAQSNHSHGFSTDSRLGDHNHTINISNWGGNHSHTLSTNSVSGTHNHGFSGTTGSHNILHNHSFTGTASSSGSGLGTVGISSSSLPASVSVFVDGVLAAGPFNGQFSSGALNLSPFVSLSGEHALEIREEGESGGRISYNLFVE